MSGQSTSSSVHSARPASTSRSSLASKGVSAGRAIEAASGERTEYFLQPCRGFARLRAQLRQRPDPAQAAVRNQQEAVADALGIDQLVDGEHEGATAGRDLANDLHDLTRLAQ